jgi:hypothetical protein
VDEEDFYAGFTRGKKATKEAVHASLYVHGITVGRNMVLLSIPISV